MTAKILTHDSRRNETGFPNGSPPGLQKARGASILTRRGPARRAGFIPPARTNETTPTEISSGFRHPRVEADGSPRYTHAQNDMRILKSGAGKQNNPSSKATKETKSMKIKIQTLGIAALLPVVLLACSSCSTESKSEDLGLTATQPGEPGGVRAETYKETSTVSHIDKATRQLTLVAKDGTGTTVTVGPEVANFDQIEVGDQVKTTVTVQFVVAMRKPGESSGDVATTSVALTPTGAKPGAQVESTVEITAKVKAIDLKNRKATLLFPDGTSKTFKVRKDVDLTKRSVGEDVLIRATQALAISVEKP
jgi:hypothetical protein